MPGNLKSLTREELRAYFTEKAKKRRKRLMAQGFNSRGGLKQAPGPKALGYGADVPLQEMTPEESRRLDALAMMDPIVRKGRQP